VTTSKDRGLNTATLRWSGTSGAAVTVIVDGQARSVADTGSWVHQTGQRGNPTIRYQVCDATACSEVVHVSAW
jgi:hypothetical protein